MKSLIKNIFTFCLFFTFACNPQQESSSGNNALNARNTPAIFPDDFIGKWKGILKIYNRNIIVNEVDMQLHILPEKKEDHYSYHIIYGKDTINGLRPYTIIPNSKEEGVWSIDENNGIVLDEYIIDGKAFSLFEVGGNLLQVTLEKNRDELIYEISVANQNAYTLTGDTIIQNDTIPSVKNFEIKAIQKAILKKM